MIERVSEKVWLHFKNTREVERILVEHRREIDVTAARAMDLRKWVDRADARFDDPKLSGRDEIGLIEQYDVGEGELLLRFMGLIDLGQHVFGVDHRDDGIEPG